MTDYTVAQLDFVLEMAAIDQPDNYSFTRGDIASNGSERPAALANWSKALHGSLLANYMNRIGVTKGNDAIAKWRAKRSYGALQPGYSRGGRPIDVRD